MAIRDPAVQGRFYPETKAGIEKLISQIERNARFPLSDISIKTIFGAVLPHAGHIFSGHQTVPFFQLLNKQNIQPDTFIIVHPNHSGYGEPVSLDENRVWQNALGEVEMDHEFTSFLNIPECRSAHAYEHSGEVIIPFIQYFFNKVPFKIVPICMLDQSYGSALKLGQNLYMASRNANKKIIVIASSDFSHFMSAEEGFKADQYIVDAVLKGDTEGVHKTVKRHNISVCGYGPIMTLMVYSGLVDNKYKTRVLARGDSGQVSPSREVVDYISILFYS